MIILVSMSSMKFLQKTKQKTGASKKKWAHTESFLSAPFCQGNLMYPVYIYIYIYIGPKCAEFIHRLGDKSSL